ncbi:MAG: HepT-like ribonuclease domain-containing protein [Nitrosomonadaceae bacterium]
MSLRNPKKYLYDIIDCCEFLLDFTNDKTVDDYKNDRPFRSAVERELQIIGEAIAQLDNVSPETADQISEFRNIIGFRNILVHGYDSLDPETVWSVIEEKLATLLDQSRSLL